MIERNGRAPDALCRTIFSYSALCCWLMVINAIRVHADDAPRTRTVEAPVAVAPAWSATPPADCPLEKSTLANSIRFTGRHRAYTGADTWYPSWASDGKLYSPFADGNVNGVAVMWNNHLTGHAMITGEDPLKLDVGVIGTFKVVPQPHGGVYPCGTLVKDGVWYYGYYA